MTSATSLAAAYLVDCVTGDPEWFPHPVRIMGVGAQAGEKLLRRFSNCSRYEIASGGILTIALAIGSAMFVRSQLGRVKRRSRRVGVVAEVLLSSTCLATRSLLDETGAVLAALDGRDLEAARQKLSRIVGRDTHSLNESEICRAVIETLAESLSDGVIAPLFYLAIGGAPLAMAYKAINTLDSMIGHKDERYLYFGKVAARLDDGANYLPSRLTALLICGSTLLHEPRAAQSALATWRSDGHKHASPNAGQPESAMAGALRVKLGGANCYGGEVIHSPFLGEKFPEPALKDAKRARRQTALVSLLGLGAAIFMVRALKHD